MEATTASAKARRWLHLGWREPSRLAWIALAVLLVAAGAFLYRETRGTTLWFDEWEWATERRGYDLGTFLRPHNGHLSLVPVAIYKLLFATAGLGNYAPYRAMVIVGHLGCVVLVFTYAKRRVASFPALLAATLILFFGPGWQNIIWPFQVGWLISLAAGLGALLVLDRGDRAGDAVAGALLALSLASSGLGVAIALGVAVDVLWGRRRWRDAWIVAAPLAVYALWWLSYQDSNTFRRHNIVVAPGFVADAAAGTIAALTGLGGQAIPDTPGTLLDWGRPLLIGAAVLLAWRLAALRPIPPRILTLVTIPVSFWVLTALNRAQSSPAFASRYLYVGAIFVVLLAVELARGTSLQRRATLVVTAAVAAVVVSNLGAFRDSGRFLRGQAQLARADVGALELARPLVRDDFVAAAFPGFPFLAFDAGSYFAAVRSFGSPAASPAEIAAQPEAARRVADAQLVAIHEVGPKTSRGRLRPGARPEVDSVAGGTASGRQACVFFRPASVASAGSRSSLEVKVPPAGLLLTAEDGPATLGVRRFADEFQPVGRLAGSAPATLRIGPDRASAPWHLRVLPAGRATVCGLA